jgi:hypothetical protein
LGEDLPAECPAPPFAVTIADGPDVRPLSVPGAVAVQRTEGRNDTVEVWMAGFPFGPDDIAVGEPPFAGKGSWAVLHLSGRGPVDHSTFEAGDIVPWVSAADSPTGYRVGPEVQPNMTAERRNANPGETLVQQGEVRVVYADDEILCLDMALSSNLGASVTGRITATRA